jgi:uncharacterized protein
MNEYSDLFSKNPDSNSPLVPKPQIDAIAEFELNAKNRKINSLTLVLYFGITLLFIGLSVFYTDSLYSDRTLLLDQISVFTEPTFDLIESEDPLYDYQVNLIAGFRNDSTENLAAFVIDVTFFDENNESIGIGTWSIEQFVANGEWNLEDTFLINGTPVRLEVFGYLTVPNQTGVFLSLIPTMVLAFLYLFIDWSNFRDSFRRFFQRFGKSFGDIAIGVILVYAALIFANFVLTLLGETETSQNEMAIQAMFENNAIVILMLFFLLCVFTPIVEEIVFRKVLFGFFEPKLGPIVAIVLSGLIFGFMHVLAGDLIQAIPYVLMGFAFGYIYYRSEKNILVPIIVHFINNFIVFLLYAPSFSELF